MLRCCMRPVCLLLVALVLSACSQCSLPSSDDSASSTEPRTDPMAKCDHCLERICAPCKGSSCIPARKLEHCTVMKIAIAAKIGTLSTDEEKIRACTTMLNKCAEEVAHAEKMAMPPTPESDPLDYARLRISDVRRTQPDAKQRRRELACEAYRKINAQDRSERITRKMLETRPRRYVGQPVHLDGQVIQAFDLENEESALLVIVGSNNVHVLYHERSDLVKGERVRFFGYVVGDYSYTTVAGWNLTVPEVAALSVGSYRELHPYDFHCPDPSSHRGGR